MSDQATFDEIDPEILEEFIKETTEELEGLDPQFIALENNPGDADVINAIFRTVHSIKGSSAFFNLNHIRNFAHKLENLLDELRKGKRSVSTAMIDVLLKGTDFLKAMLDRLAGGDLSVAMTPGEEAHLKVVEQVLEGAEPGGEPRGEPRGGGEEVRGLFDRLDAIRERLTGEGLGDHPLVNELYGVVALLRQASCAGTPPSPSGDDEGGEPVESPKLGEVLIEAGLATREDINAALGQQRRIGEVLVERGKLTEAQIGEAVRRQQETTAAAQADAAQKRAASRKKTMRIEEEKIDGFMDLVGELIINAEVFNYLQKKLELGHDLDKLITEFKNANLDFNELTFNLQRGLAEVRKVSINGIFQKFPRMVRDLAAGMGKQVEFSMRGEDILIDKSLFEALESPLNHIMRNSVDHGVEMPADRAAAGKDPTGQVRISATETAGNLVIDIYDDGKGLDAAKLKAKAVEKGILSPHDAEVMHDRDAHQLIFAPGFSTAAKITDVSGRGVGMDVVMTAVKEAKGRIDIDTQPGQGTTLSLVLPMSTTLITISGLLVAVGKENYIIPMEWVRESLQPKPEQVSSVRRSGEIVEIRSQLYPLIRLHRLFNVPPRAVNPCDGVVMVIEKEERRCCILVDEIIEETQVVLKDLGETFRHIKGIMGGAILGDGKVGLVLNVEGVMAEVSEGEPAEAAAKGA